MVELDAAKETMTLNQARKALRWYYVAIEIIKKYDACRYELASPGLSPIGSEIFLDESAAARNVIRKVSLEQDVQPIRDAIAKLSHVYQNFIQMRYQLEMSLRQIARELNYGKSTVQEIEVKVLKGFIKALGKEPIDS